MNNIVGTLLGCPFCKTNTVHLWVEELSEGVWYVLCNVCHAKGPVCADRKLAIEFWNNSWQEKS